MKKAIFLLTSIFTLLISGCTIYYDNTPSAPSTPEGSTTPSNPSDPSTPEGSTTPLDPSDSSTPEANEREPLNIDEDVLFYPSSLNLESELIKNYSYIDSSQTGKYAIYSAYYSEFYDTIYIAYDLVATPTQTLKAKDLYEIEMHAVNYFESDETRSEDKNYLKAVRIYPDRLASSCRKGISDESANNINGCADYGGKEAIIDLNNTSSLDDFYNEKKIRNGLTYTIYEPMRDTFAHEYGHVSTFYHMAYKSDEDYEDYLKLRLGNEYSTIYPSGLPSSYTSSANYDIMPEEILADDFVELFYNTSNKKDDDTTSYILSYNDLRNSLMNNESVRYLKNNTVLYAKVKEYFKNNFFTNKNKTTYDKPVIITTSNSRINYYESYSKIGNTSNLKTIIASNINLIAVGEVTINSTKYYRVILSNTFHCPSNRCNQKEVGKAMGYVASNEYSINNSLKLYSINKNNDQALSKTSIIPLNNVSNSSTISEVYFLPHYDFSYVLNTTNDTNYATMYDYLNTKISNYQYRINIYSFGTLIN